MNINRLLLPICGLILFASACKKDTAKKTGCTTTMHGYTAPVSNMFDTIYSCSHGIINLSKGYITSAGSFSSSVMFTTEAAFNTSDNSYYLFKAPYTFPGALPDLLYQVDASGKTTSFAPSDTFKYSKIVYNKITNKLYSTRNTGALAEITPAGSTFSAIDVVKPVHPFCTNITVDNNTGDMYYGTTDKTTFYVERYRPGSGSSVVVASRAFGALLVTELRFNKNDNMLYALQLNSDTITTDFIKINPSIASIASVAHLGSLMNVDAYSATLDPCSNRYVLSTLPGTNTFVVYQMDMSGTILEKDTATSFYQGLDAEE